MKNIFYISYMGMLEPLGESQVLNYLKKTATHNRITLLSFEKKSDLSNTKEFLRIRKLCTTSGIDWQIAHYHKKPRLLATLYDVYIGVIIFLRFNKKQKQHFVHARGQVPSIMALVIKKITNTKFIFDMRAFSPEERVNSGRISDMSLLYKSIVYLRLKCIQECSHLITITNSALEHLHQEPGLKRLKEKATVIPTCVDMDSFQSFAHKKNARPFVLGVVGTVTGWVDLPRILKFYKVLKIIRKDADLRIVTRDSSEYVYRAATKLNINMGDIDIVSIPFREVPKEINKMHAGVFFYKAHVSEIARSPTKMGEFLACGVPCISNAEVGDVANILEKFNVGITLKDNSDENMHKAVTDLLDLLSDKNIKVRCRNAAEEWYSLDKGAGKHLEIYNSI